MDEQMWYYARNGVQQGPVSTAALRELLASGSISKADLVWRTGMPTWQSIGAQPEFSGAIPVSDSIPPVQPPIPALPFVDAQSSNIKLAFVLAIIGLVMSNVGFVFGIVAIVLAAGALSAMKQGNRHARHGMAIAALVIGILDLLHGPFFPGLVHFHYRW